MEKIEMWKASDGTKFDCEDDCAIHEVTPDFIKHVQGNALQSLEPAHVAKWIAAHKTEVRRLLAGPAVEWRDANDGVSGIPSLLREQAS